MLFFQVVLLAGYAYAHLLVSRLGPRRQAWCTARSWRRRGTLVVAFGVWAPDAPGSLAQAARQRGADPRILTLLALDCGLPYFVLSTTGRSSRPG